MCSFKPRNRARRRRDIRRLRRRPQSPCYFLFPPGWPVMDCAVPLPPPPPMRSLVLDLLLLTVVVDAAGSGDVVCAFFSSAKPAGAVTNISKPPHSSDPIKRIVMMCLLGIGSRRLRCRVQHIPAGPVNLPARPTPCRLV